MTKPEFYNWLLNQYKELNTLDLLYVDEGLKISRVWQRANINWFIITEDYNGQVDVESNKYYGTITESYDSLKDDIEKYL